MQVNLALIIWSILGLIGLIIFYRTTKWVLTLRTVVGTNEVHIVQDATGTRAFGRNQEGGNTYYMWPEWIPFVGRKISVLPLSTLAVEIKDYEAYDTDKVTFKVDISAFLRIKDASLAAQSIQDINAFKAQMMSVVQGGVRKVLSGHTLPDILVDRKKMSDDFTQEVGTHLSAWGVETAKNIEFMDIRDADGSKVIQTIRAEKISEIEKNSRIKVANNAQLATSAEQEAARTIGLSKATTDKEVALAQQLAQQEVQAAAKITAERQVEAQRALEVGQAETRKQANVIQAEELAKTQVINAEAAKTVQITNAEAAKQKAVIQSEGELQAATNNATGIKSVGDAEAGVIKEKGLAKIAPEVELAEKIGENAEYQNYMINMSQVEANKAIGIENAKALDKAEIKIIVGADGPSSGIQKVTDLFSIKGGNALGAMFEAAAQTEMGQRVLSRITGGKEIPPETAK